MASGRNIVSMACGIHQVMITHGTQVILHWAFRGSGVHQAVALAGSLATEWSCNGEKPIRDFATKRSAGVAPVSTVQLKWNMSAGGQASEQAGK